MRRLINVSCCQLDVSRATQTLKPLPRSILGCALKSALTRRLSAACTVSVRNDAYSLGGLLLFDPFVAAAVTAAVTSV